MGLAGIASTGGAFFNKVYATDIENITSEKDKNSIIEIIKLPDTGSWPTRIHSFSVYIIMMCIHQQIKI